MQDMFALGGRRDAGKLQLVNDALKDIRTQMAFCVWPGVFNERNVNDGYWGELADAIIASYPPERAAQL